MSAEFLFDFSFKSRSTSVISELFLREIVAYVSYCHSMHEFGSELLHRSCFIAEPDFEEFCVNV